MASQTTRLIKKPRSGGMASLIVKRHASVDLEPGFIHPAKPGRVEPHEHIIDSRVEPIWRPLPEEERRKATRSAPARENQHGLAVSTRPTANETPARNTIVGSEKTQGRSEVVGEMKTGRGFLSIRVGQHVIEKHHRRQMQKQNRHACRRAPPQTWPRVLAGPKRSRVEQFTDSPLLVLNDWHPGGDGDEKAVEEQRHDRKLHGDCELRRDVGLHPAHRRVARLDSHATARKPPGDKGEDQEPKR